MMIAGYNTDWWILPRRDVLTPRAIPVFEQIFPTKETRERGLTQNVKLMTIWLGTSAEALRS